MTMAALDIGVPSDYGLPQKFRDFRGAQTKALTRIVEETYGGIPRPRFRGEQMPVGSGKTAYYMAVHSLRAMLNPLHRTAIVVTNKPLQEQIMEEFREMGVADIRGRGNYQCRFWENCESGADNGCSYRFDPNLCDYTHQVQTACSSRIVVTNLSYWVMQHRYGQGLGQFDLLILDEAHSLLSGLTDFAKTSWRPDEGPQGVNGRLEMQNWIDWADQETPYVERQLLASSNPDKTKRLKERLRKLLVLASATPRDYAVDVEERTNWAQINAVWPADFAERDLYLGIPEVILLSGTLIEKTMDFVGAGRRGDSASRRFTSYGLEFPPSEWPVSLVDVGNIDKNSSLSTKLAWKKAHASLARAHKNLPGLAHTVSYQRMREVAAMIPPEEQHRVITHKQGGDAMREAVESYKERLRKGDPAILVSPALSTGFDFPEPEESFTILSKMPRQDFSSIPNLRSARKARDSSYEDFEMMMAFAQSIGRIKRRPGQRARVYVLDSHARYLVPKHLPRKGGELVPGWVDDLLVWGRKGDPVPRPVRF